MALRQLASCLSNNGLRMQAANPSLGFGLLRAYSTVMQGYKYASSHEWANAEGDVATVGISDFAQSELGDVVYVELPEVGATLTKGQTFGVVESVKAASDVYSPVSGEVVEINSTLADEPAKVNKEPFAGGWMLKVKMSDKKELGTLLNAHDYEKKCESKH